MGSGYSRGFKDSIGCLSERYDHKDMDSKRNLGKKVNWGFARVYSGRDWQDSGFTKLFERDVESRGSCTRYSRYGFRYHQRETSLDCFRDLG
uniref:Uncharacterized protein n=1 Tax=Brassica oleracea var. oleracea TaxID=109376 RepID=A0A0D3C240_BRAOL